jgi:hypothetical protein
MWEYEEYHSDEEEQDYAYWEEDTWDWGRFLYPLILIFVLLGADRVFELSTRPPNYYITPPSPVLVNGVMVGEANCLEYRGNLNEYYSCTYVGKR